ncbi:MAG: hypothetical protein RR387_03235 [Clostridiales bacterium]
MFPLVHYYVNTKIFAHPTSLMVLGGIFPDLASGMGLERNAAHQMGVSLFTYCQEHQPQAIDFARGVLSHGIIPRGVDYYADESWPGCEKGWCFEQGKPWLKQLQQVTGLPNHLLWWKSHNFVEIGCELLTHAAHPGLNHQLLQALQDRQALTEAAAILAAYSGCNAQKAVDVFLQTPNIFALHSIDPFSLAQKQAISFANRHNIHNCDINGMARLLEQISDSLTDQYQPFMDQILSLVAENLRPYQ